ncbi:UNVERIFIED_CONTAM: Transposon Ty3-G Gag-Pol polyprotein [Sesamum latifolium]|uniref:Transposon Ty3-G Gag-Pol polyprotein n=1 Tax=Sesamum latifolium TaxID=2727402 RepID=A0AAW2XHD5_9LAMI
MCGYKEVTIIEIPEEDIAFSSKDLERGILPHNDALVISATVSNSGQYPPDGIQWECRGVFGRNRIANLHRNCPSPSHKDVEILVVDAPSTYNIIRGSPSLNSFRAVASTYHMKLKFPTYRGIGEEKGDCRVARECHASILKRKTNPPIERENQMSRKEEDKARVARDGTPPASTLRQPEQQLKRKRMEEEKVVAIEELKDVQVVEDEPGKTASIRTTMEQKVEVKLIRFLKTNSDVFFWTVHDLVGIDPKVMTHKLNINPAFRPVRQKKRNFGQERNEIIKEKVEKLLTAEYIRPVQYPEWLANVVLVPKSNKKWRMCIDFTDLNRVCPKDSYPLPRIDALVDSTAGCEMMNFLVLP